MTKGWFAIPGVQDGPRTLAEQMMGLDAAIAETPGKSVLDLGCAEGLISLEFAKAGAESVRGIEFNPNLIEAAENELSKVWPLPVRFDRVDLRRCGAAEQKYDIVLALAILHKLDSPMQGAKFCCDSAKSLIVARLPIGSTGVIEGKHSPGSACDLNKEFARYGFKIERKEAGPRGEWVHYYRKC